MDQATRVEFDLTVEDIIQFYGRYVRLFGSNRLRLPLTLLALLLVPAAMLVDLLTGGQSFWLTGVCAAVAVAVLVLFWLIFPRSVKRLARQAYLSSADLQRPVAMEVGDGLLTVSYATSRHRLTTDGLFCCCETPTHFFFFENRYTAQGHVLPKSALTSQQVEGLSDRLSALFADRYRRS